MTAETSTRSDHQFNRSGDLWGGLAAMLVALPSAVAFGVAVFAPLGESQIATGAVYGITGAIVLGIVAGAMGGTPRLVTAPCAPAAAILGAISIELASSTTSDPLEAAFLLAVVAGLAGLLQFVFGTVGGGKLIKYIPYPVVSGYLTGVGVLILVKQLPSFLGLSHGTKFGAALLSPGTWNPSAIVIGLATMLATVHARKLTRKIPAAIIGVSTGMLAYAALALANPALRTLEGNPLVIGSIASGSDAIAAAANRWRAVAGITMEDLAKVIWQSGTLAVLLSIDTLKTCVIVDALTRTRHDSNKELRGQGIANLATTLVGGMPGAGTIGATLVNITSGGVTRLSSIAVGGFALAAFLIFGPLLAWIPLPALSGILFVVGYRMIDRRAFQLLKQPSTYLDFLVIATVVLTAIFGNLIAASGAGLALAVVLFVREQIRANIIRRKTYGNQLFSQRKRIPEDIELLRRRGGETVICELQGNLFFGTTDRLVTELNEDLKKCKHVILDMKRVQTIDFTATHILKQIGETLRSGGGELIISELPRDLPTGRDLQAYLDEVGIADDSAGIRIFKTLEEALEWCERLIFESENRGERPNAPPSELEEFDLFKDADTEAFRVLRSCITERSVKEGEWIFKGGDVGDEVYLIRKGVVKILLPISGDRFKPLASFARRDFFGEIAFLDRETRSAGALAVTNVELYVLSRNRFNKVSRDLPAIGSVVFARLARALAHRMRQADLQIRMLEEN